MPPEKRTADMGAEGKEGLGHTPGPWWIEGRRGVGYLVSAGLNSEGDGPADYACVVTPAASVNEPGEFRANARLIAAAPELLEAAQSALDHLEGIAERGHANPLTYHNIRVLRAAIAKAEAR